MAEEANDDESHNATSNSKSSVFDRLQPFTSQKHPSVFSRMGKDKTSKSFVFHRLRGDKQLKPLVFARIKTGDKSSSLSLMRDKNSMFNHLGEVNEVQSSIPSCIKCISTLHIKTTVSYTHLTLPTKRIV